jgi:hypothetical protein
MKEEDINRLLQRKAMASVQRNGDVTSDVSSTEFLLQDVDKVVIPTHLEREIEPLAKVKPRSCSFPPPTR